MADLFYIKTFGCQMNERDSEIISQSLSQHNYVETSELEEADLIVLNTCSIRAKAEQKVMSMLGVLRKNKKKNPHLKICVAGCVAQQEGEKLIEKMPHVDLVIGTQHIYDIYSLLQKADTENVVHNALVDDYIIPRFIPQVHEGDGICIEPSSRFSRFVTIMQGCNNFCTYCVVPYTRGREVSRKVSDIVDEVNALVESGVVEITLLGQNVNSYGKTNSVYESGASCTFAQLLKKVSKIKGLRRLRFTTSNPKDLTNELMQCFRDLENLCPQFHLPVQSGSNSVLARMNRKYTREKYLSLINSLREYRPEIVLTTDVIVGFPGETEHDFSQTMDLLEKVRFDGSFSFKYSDRPGTASSKLPDKVDEKTQSERLLAFQKRQNQISLEKNREYIGKRLHVLVEKRNAESYQCRATTNHIVHVASPTLLDPGDEVQVNILHAGEHSLKATIT